MMANADEIRKYLNDAKQVPCLDWLIPMYILKESKMPPIWVDVDAAISASPSLYSLDKMAQYLLSQSKAGIKLQSDATCVADVKSALQISNLQRSYTKSSLAKTFFTW